MVAGQPNCTTFKSSSYFCLPLRPFREVATRFILEEAGRVTWLNTNKRQFLSGDIVVLSFPQLAKIGRRICVRVIPTVENFQEDDFRFQKKKSKQARGAEQISIEHSV